MKGFWKYFWIIYILFFAIPFPMLIYYMTSYKTGTLDTNPWLAMIYLAAAVVLWVILLTIWFKKWVLMVFRMQNNVHYLLKDGVKKEARVMKSKVLKAAQPNVVTREIVCYLRNFSNAEITQQLTVNDSQPALNRYDVGKTIQLRIDEKLKAIPVIIPDGVQVSINNSRVALFFLLWLLVAAIVVGYFPFSYLLENNGTGWRFLQFFHPLVLVPLILLVTRWGVSKLVLLSGNMSEKDLKIKYYGLRANAEIISASQTGVYINAQPQVRFELNFLDYQGVTRTAILKRIVPLMDIGSIQQSTVPIFYLKDKPNQVAFARDIDG